MARFYVLCGYTAGIFILVIAAAILIQIVGRALGANLFGLIEISTYAMVGATFVALPYTLQTGGHIRVHLIVGLLRGRPRRTVDLAGAAIAFCFAVIFLYYAVDLTLDSYQRSARSQGMLAAPIWIPQAFMTCGIGLFAIAIFDHLVRLVRTGVASDDENQQAI